MSHPIYNRYGNPFASPLELRDNGTCTECGDETGITGESAYGEQCGFCFSFYTLTKEEEDAINDMP
jgi:hypothetical protein